MKKWLAVLLAVAMLFTLAACGGGANKKALVGTWQLVDTETETEYGLGIEFTKDGKLRYGLTEEVLQGLAEGEDPDDLMAGLDMLMSIEYKVKSDTEMEVTMKALLGLAKESTMVEYSLSGDGDTLVFDGTTYSRVK